MKKEKQIKNKLNDNYIIFERIKKELVGLTNELNNENNIEIRKILLKQFDEKMVEFDTIYEKIKLLEWILKDE